VTTHREGQAVRPIDKNKTNYFQIQSTLAATLVQANDKPAKIAKDDIPRNEKQMWNGLSGKAVNPEILEIDVVRTYPLEQIDYELVTISDENVFAVASEEQGQKTSSILVTGGDVADGPRASATDVMLLG